MADFDINTDPYRFRQKVNGLFTEPVSGDAVKEILSDGAETIACFEDTADHDMLTNAVHLLTRYVLHLEARLAELENRSVQ